MDRSMRQCNKMAEASSATLSRAALPIMAGLNGFYPTMAQYGGLDVGDFFPPYKAVSDDTCHIVDHLSALNEVLFYAETGTAGTADA
ncbi:hypothetical protein MRX96_003164 [Rhipicephalus microplus]